MERIAEVLFGLIMVLSFTGSLSVAETGHEEVRTMLIGAVGCNLAWGIIDGVFYLMTTLAERGRALSTGRAVQRATNPAEAERIIADALPPPVAAVLQPSELASIRQRLQALPEPAAPAHLRKDDYLAAVGVFLWVFVSTFPVVLPFVFMADARPALRFSNGIAIAMLFGLGWLFGRLAGHRPWLMGLAMVLVGGALVAMTIALGG